MLQLSAEKRVRNVYPERQVISAKAEDTLSEAFQYCLGYVLN